MSAASPAIGEPSPTQPTTERDVVAAKAALLTYVARANEVDYDDPVTFEPVYAAVTGEQLKFEIDTHQQFAELAWRREGNSQLTLSELAPASVSDGHVEFAICIDTSDVRFYDADDHEWIRRDNEPVTPMTATVIEADADRWLVALLARREGTPACPPPGTH